MTGWAGLTVFEIKIKIVWVVVIDSAYIFFWKSPTFEKLPSSFFQVVQEVQLDFLFHLVDQMFLLKINRNLHELKIKILYYMAKL